MRSSAALVYNCKQAHIVLAGTSFATTGALAPPRSAERKVRLRKGEGVRMNTQVNFQTPPAWQPPPLIQEEE